MSALYFFMRQRYVPPGGGQDAPQWVDEATRWVELNPAGHLDKLDPVAGWVVQHLKGRRGGPYRVKVKEFAGRELRQQYVIHNDGSRTQLSD